MEFDDDITRLPESSGHPAALQLQAGEDFGPYRILRLLGRGGMGEVYEVEHRDLRSRHAIKLISPDILERTGVKERFKREAVVMARLRHPNIVHVDDFSELNGRIWLRMELLNGWTYSGKTYHSLHELMRDQGALPESLVRRFLGEILDGLGFAHDAGAVHRDLKPANLLLDEEGRVKITDFGLVSLAGADWLQSQVQLTVARSMADPDATRMESESSSTGTSTQALLGTYAYMSPEQKKSSDVDARSDLYAVGLIGFQMLTGDETPGFEMLSDIVDGLNPAWDDWVRLGLASRADRRFSDAGRMKDDLPGGDVSVPPLPQAEKEEAEPSCMDQEFTNLEERIQEKVAPPPVPEFEAEPTSEMPEQVDTLAPVQRLSDKDLKKTYTSARIIIAYGAVVGFASAFLLIMLLAGLSVIPEMNRNSWILLGFSLWGLLYWYWSVRRIRWHRIVSIVFNLMCLLSFNLFFEALFFFPFTILSVISLYHIFRNNDLFASRPLRAQELKAELKRRSLRLGPSVVTTFALMVVFLLVSLSIVAYA